ncbi:stage III sporulation protein AH [Lachnospiraceae bacterium XBB1006]|nr:stage III sporulation protein AH [Lachnospiraceae bacterium XBB1006]
MKRRRLKNQCMITALVILIAAGGCVSFWHKDHNFLKEAMGKGMVKEKEGRVERADEMDDLEDAGEAIMTSGKAANNYAASARLKREQAHAKAKEELTKLSEKQGILPQEKKEVMKKLMDLATAQDAEVAIENLLEAKGFKNVVVSIGGDSVDVVVDLSVVSEKDLAKINEVVCRKYKCNPQSIVVTPLRVE